MRIIAGNARGRRLAAPHGRTTRPTPDRVREALFSMLGSVEGLRVLDLYAGTGALGLEALSRGAGAVVFVEKDRHAVEVLRRNVAWADAAAITVMHMSADKALGVLAQRGQRFDLILLDPPYDLDALPHILDTLMQLDLARDGAVIVCEHHRGQAPPPAPAGMQHDRTRNYGDVCLSLYTCNERPVT